MNPNMNQNPNPNVPMQKPSFFSGRKILILIIFFLLVSNLFSLVTYFQIRGEAERLHEFALQSKAEIDGNVLSFFQLFVDDVLKKRGPVGYATRVALDQRVLEIDDKELSVAWNLFLQSTSEDQAQIAATTMLQRISVLLLR